jgi:type II secretory pathway predicted ATPase ExeA
MYESFFGFNEKPFSLLCDPAFLYRSKSHGYASAMLSYGLLNQAGFTVITGPVGIGKTTLIRSTLRNLPEEVVVGVISNTHPDMGNLLQWALLAFEQDYKSKSRVELYDWFVQFLKSQHAAGRRVVLIIDEAQNLSRLDLEELRMLSNINSDKDQILQLILVGQPQLRDLLGHPYLMQFSQRVAADYDIKPLDQNETTNYIFNRCRVAGVNRGLFTYAAAELIYHASQGIPRVINVICDTALAYAFGVQQKWVSEDIVIRVVEDRKASGLISLGELPATSSENTDLIAPESSQAQAQVADIGRARGKPSRKAFPGETLF